MTNGERTSLYKTPNHPGQYVDFKSNDLPSTKNKNILQKVVKEILYDEKQPT